jgi:hypothetical protein
MIKACPYGRRSGRTTWMIDQIIEEVENVLPYNILVVAATERDAFRIMKNVIERLQTSEYTETGKMELIIKENTIKFIGATRWKNSRQVHRGSEYWDHFAAGES